MVSSTSFLSIMSMVPANMTTIPIPDNAVNDSPRKMKASIMVSTVLLLSIGATLLTFPIFTALK